MKKFLLCAVIAIIGCCFIFACENTEGSSSENPPIHNPSEQKTISQIIANYGYFEGYSGRYYYTFIYNEHNRVEQIYVVYNDGESDRCISIDYNGTTINISDSQSDRQYPNAEVNNLGYITYWKDTRFTYNHKGQIINDYYESTSSGEFGGSISTTYEWRNDNIESVQRNSGNDRQSNYIVKYNDNKYTNAVNLDLNWFVDPMNVFGSNNVDWELATIGLMGKRCKNYITELCRASKDFKITGVRASYDWTYDRDGYPIKCEVTEYASGEEYISTYLFIYSE